MEFIHFEAEVTDDFLVMTKIKMTTSQMKNLQLMTLINKVRL